jgi:hypothetical protein
MPPEFPDALSLASPSFLVSHPEKQIGSAQLNFKAVILLGREFLLSLYWPELD